MSQALGQVAIVCQNEKTFGLGVETADIEKTRELRRQQIEDRVARIWIASRGDKTSRLMKHDVEPALAVNEFTVDLDVVAIAGLGAEIRADLAVDRDPA